MASVISTLTRPDVLKPKLRERFIAEIRRIIENNSVTDAFIAKNRHIINQQVDNMYKDYEDDGDLEELLAPENDWFREYIWDEGELDEKLRAITKDEDDDKE
jgi:hypothetical protein